MTRLASVGAVVGLIGLAACSSPGNVVSSSPSISSASSGGGSTTPPTAVVTEQSSATTPSPASKLPPKVLDALRGSVVSLPNSVERSSASFADVVKIWGQSVPPQFDGVPVDVYFATGDLVAMTPGPPPGSVLTKTSVRSVVAVARVDNGDVVFGGTTDIDVSSVLPVVAVFTVQ